MKCKKCKFEYRSFSLHDGLCFACLVEEYDRTKQHYVELLEAAFKEIATECTENEFVNSSPLVGWWDTCGRSTACDYGDRLAKLRLWEKHPDGVGNRQWYRKIEKEKLQLAQGD